jgi:hypothetical protein
MAKFKSISKDPNNGNEDEEIIGSKKVFNVLTGHNILTIN